MGFCLTLMKLPQWFGSQFESSSIGRSAWKASQRLNYHLILFGKEKLVPLKVNQISELINKL